MSDSVRPHRRQPTRLRHPWDSPGKDTWVGCHFLLQCRKVKSEREVTQSCPTLSDPIYVSNTVLHVLKFRWDKILIYIHIPNKWQIYTKKRINNPTTWSHFWRIIFEHEIKVFPSLPPSQHNLVGYRGHVHEAIWDMTSI